MEARARDYDFTQEPEDGTLGHSFATHLLESNTRHFRSLFVRGVQMPATLSQAPTQP